MAFRLPVLLALVALALMPPVARAATTAIDGPSAALTADQFVATAASPDGHAAVAYLKQVGGVPRVFASRLSGETWSAPVQVDANLPAGFSSEAPSVGVARGGKVVVLFPSEVGAGKRVYAAVAPSAGQPFGGATVVAGDPAYKFAKLALAPNGDGYAVLRTEPAGNPDLYAVQYRNGTWTPLGGSFPAGALDATASNPAAEDDVHGFEVATAENETAGVVVWTESVGIGQYQLFARRFTGAAIGAAVPATTPGETLDGHARSDLASDMADVAMDGGGTAWVAFRQAYTYGAQDRFRGLARSFDGAAFGPLQVTDGLGSAPAENVEYQSLAVNGSGRGIVATYRGLTNVAEGSALNGGSWLSSAFPLSPGPADSASRASVALSDSGGGLYAFRHSAGGGAQPVILGRVRDATGALGAPQTLSSAAFGQAGSPFAAAASDGFAVTAFAQGTAATVRIVAATVPLPQPAAPGTGTPTGSPAGADTTAPRISGLRVTPSAFRTGSKPGSVRPAATRSPAAIRLTLSEAATVRLSAERLLAGRRSGRRCVRPTRRNRRARRCVRAVAQGGTVPLALPAGAARLRFAGRLARALAPGSYRLVAIATDAAGNRAAPKRASFTILAPKRR